MTMKWAITTNKTTFFHYGSKADAQKVAADTVAKFAANYGDTVLKIKKIWFG